MKISIGGDHAGYKLKNFLLSNIKHPNNIKIDIQDSGCYNNLVKVDYTHYCESVVNSILNNESKFGILICNTGIGMSILANRFAKIRAALCFNTEMAYLTRSHNNANILCLGQSYLDINHDGESQKALDIVHTFLSTEFANKDRYRKRNDALSLVGEK